MIPFPFSAISLPTPSLKTLGMIAGALLIIGSIFAAYRYVDGLSDALNASQRALAEERFAREAAELTSEQVWQQAIVMQQAHAANLKRLRDLEAANRAADEELARTRQTITDLQLEKIAYADELEAARRANAVARDLNRMLERASTVGLGSGPRAPEAGAGKPAGAATPAAR